MGMILLYIFAFFVACFCYPEDGRITRATIESCTGCSLTKYPEVKKFIEYDILQFEDVTFKEVPGSSPTIVFFNQYDQELGRHLLKCKYREECSELLLKKGFKRNIKILKESHAYKDF